MLKEIESAIKYVNGKAISRAQQIRKWSLIEGDFSVNGGELTPTLKLKRKAVEGKYKNTIEMLYRDPKI